MLTHSFNYHNCGIGLMPYFKPLLGKTMSLLTILITKMAFFIVSNKMEIDLPEGFSDSKEYFVSIWKSDIEYINGRKGKMIFALCLLYESVSLNIEFYWLRKTRFGIFINKISRKERCYDCD